MTSKKKFDTLFEEFPSVSAKAWKQKIQYDLKGEDYNEKLVWKSREGIHVKPFYHKDDVQGSSYGVKEVHDWNIAQSVFAGNADKANKRAKNLLKRGVETLQFTVPNKEVETGILLKEINLADVPVAFNFQFLSKEYIKSLNDHIKGQSSHLFLNIDIIGNLARSGNWYHSMDQDHEILQEILSWEMDHVFCVDSGLYENAGADIVQQLGYALAHANEYLQFLDDIDALMQLKHLTFKVSIGGNYFFEIAKLGALKILWQTLVDEYGLQVDCHIMAEPSKRNKTLYDYNMNMVRTTAECMSAILGGAQTIFNLPYDAIYHKDNNFSNRIALNQLLLLKEEAYLNKVSNVADGAYYIEALTVQLAERALELFKAIEKAGGFLRQLKEGVVQRKIRESAGQQQKQFDLGQEVLVGSNRFANASDKMKGDLELYPFVKTKPRKTLVEPIIEIRLAEAMEQIRLKDE